MSKKKFKHWLIEKLGGHVELPPRTVKFEEITIEPTTLSVFVSGNYDLRKEQMEREACIELGKALYEQQKLWRSTFIETPFKVYDDIQVSIRVLPFMED